MSGGSVTATLVVVFRETLEAGLIVGIILTVLHRLRAMRYAPHVWGSSAAAVGLSLAAGWLLGVATEATRGQWEQAIEGVISLVACVVLTHMVFWMARQARRIRPEIETRVEAAVTRHELVTMLLLPFVAVLREGAETVLFLQAVAIQSGGAASWAGGLLGGGLAAAVTAAIFVGGRRIPLKPLFHWSGWLLLLMAAGMLAYGIHELEELGWIPQLVYPVWNINHLLNEKAGVGSFLKALFGYNGNPSLTEVLAYVAYLVLIARALRRLEPPAAGPSDRPPAAARQPAQAGSA
jgi:high-affinity iron transporter